MRERRSSILAGVAILVGIGLTLPLLAAGTASAVSDPAGNGNSTVQPEGGREPVSILPPDPSGSIPGGVNIDFKAKAILGPLSDLDYNPNTDHLYTGNRRVFSVYSVLIPQTLTLVGRLEIPETMFQGGISSIAYPGSGDHVLVTVASDGLYSIDVSDPARPTIVDSLPGMASGAITIAGNRAYTSSSPRQVEAIDISDPTNLTFLGLYTQASGLTGDIYAKGDFAYVVAANGLLDPVNVWIIDFTNPAAPVKTNEIFLFDANSIGGDGNNRMYVSTAGVLYAYDVSTPSTPAFLGLDTGLANGALDLEAKNSLVYALMGSSLDIINAGNPSAMTLFGTTSDFPSYASARRLAFGASGNAYVGASSGGVQVLDILDNSMPAVVGSNPSPGDVTDVTTSGDIAFFVASSRGIFIVDNSIVDRARLVSVIENPSADVVHADGDLLYYAESDVHIVDVSDPSNPNELSTLAAFSVDGMDTVGSLLYLARGSAGLTIADVSDPANPVELSTTAVPDFPRDVEVSGSLAYIATANDGLAIYDVADPLNPSLVSTLTTPGGSEDVDVSGRYVYLADRLNDLLIIDVIDPANPLLVGLYDPGDDLRDLVVVGDLAYLAARFNGLKVVDVSTPFAPIEVGSYAVDDPFLALAFQQGYVVTCDSQAGGSTLHYVDQCFDGFEPNDEFDDAFPIAPQTSYSPLICDQNDVDYFELFSLPGDTLDITMQPPPGKDYNLFLYDAQQTLVAASVTSGDATENIVYVANAPGPYYVQVVGNAGQFDSTLAYSLFYFATGCPTPTQPVYIYTSDIDESFNVVLFVQDPNQPSTVTGYNLYRSSNPVGPFDLVGENLTDFDEGEPNVQIVDVDSASCGPLCFYRITPVNSNCGAEGPGAPDPLEDCPSVIPCNGVSCVQSGAPLSSADTGLNFCLDDQGGVVNCGNQTVHVATYDCVDAPCCFDAIPCICSIGGCPDGTYLECQ